MYSGIVQGVHPVRKVTRRAQSLSYVVELPAALREGIALGASVNIDGVCQTVSALDGAEVSFDAHDETLRVTTLGELREGSRVHVERSLKQGDENGGHLVSGHVDATVEVVDARRSEENLALVLRAPERYVKYVFEKGFIAIHGASLTVAGLDEASGTFRVHLIPETIRLTTFGEKKAGDRLNLEVERQTQVMVDTLDRALRRALAGRTF